MPFSKDPGVRESEKYCSYCFKNGKLCYEGNDVKVFQRAAYESMIKNGIEVRKALAILQAELKEKQNASR